MRLFDFRIEVGIPDLYGNTGSKFLFFPQLKCEFFHHGNEYGPEPVYVNGVGAEGGLGGYRFLLRVGHYGGVIDGIGFVPQHDAVFPKSTLEHFQWHFAERAHRTDPHVVQKLRCFFAYHRYFFYRQGRQKILFFTCRDLFFPIGLVFAYGYFRYQLIDR